MPKGIKEVKIDKTGMDIRLIQTKLLPLNIIQYAN